MLLAKIWSDKMQTKSNLEMFFMIVEQQQHELLLSAADDKTNVKLKECQAEADILHHPLY